MRIGLPFVLSPSGEWSKRCGFFVQTRVLLTESAYVIVPFDDGPENIKNPSDIGRSVSPVMRENVLVVVEVIAEGRNCGCYCCADHDSSNEFFHLISLFCA